MTDGAHTSNVKNWCNMVLTARYNIWCTPPNGLPGPWEYQLYKRIASAYTQIHNTRSNWWKIPCVVYTQTHLSTWWWMETMKWQTSEQKAPWARQHIYTEQHSTAHIRRALHFLIAFEHASYCHRRLAYNATMYARIHNTQKSKHMRTHTHTHTHLLLHIEWRVGASVFQM